MHSLNVIFSHVLLLFLHEHFHMKVYDVLRRLTSTLVPTFLDIFCHFTFQSSTKYSSN